MVNHRRTTRRLLGNGLLIGLAGGVAEVAVTWSYTALTGSDIASVGHGIADAVGLTGASATVGLGIHMVFAAGLGVALLAARPDAIRPCPFLLASLALIWAINFFIVLPLVSPAFVHLLPYAVTLASKLAFGVAAAGMLALQVPSRSGRFGTGRLPVSSVGTARS